MPISPHQLFATTPIMIMARPAASRKILSESPMFFCIFLSSAKIINWIRASLTLTWLSVFSFKKHNHIYKLRHNTKQCKTGLHQKNKIIDDSELRGKIYKQDAHAKGKKEPGTFMRLMFFKWAACKVYSSFFSERVLAQLCWQATPYSDSSADSAQTALLQALHIATASPAG